MKHLKKAEGRIDRNVVNMTIKMKTIVRMKKKLCLLANYWCYIGILETICEQTVSIAHGDSQFLAYVIIKVRVDSVSTLS